MSINAAYETTRKPKAEISEVDTTASDTNGIENTAIPFPEIIALSPDDESGYDPSEEKKRTKSDREELLCLITEKLSDLKQYEALSVIRMDCALTEQELSLMDEMLDAAVLEKIRDIVPGSDLS